MPMRNLILFDDETRNKLLPLTFTRPISDLRVGILTLREKWEIDLEGKASFISADYLSERYPTQIKEDNLVINGGVIPNPQLIHLIKGLSSNEALMNEDGDLVAARIPGDEFDSLIDGSFGDEIAGYSLRQTPVQKLTACTQIFAWCGAQIEADIVRLRAKCELTELSSTNAVIGDHPVLVCQGAKAEHAIFNTTNGPIFLGENAEVMEGAILRGPVALGKHAVIKAGAKIYGPSSFGPYCKVGGEVNNVSMQGYSNKGHDGFLGNSVLGEWCNLGADTNSSNLRNTYSPVKLWSYELGDFVQTDLMFCGLIMGDHSKAGINSMFNTATVVGVNANIYGADYPDKFIPSYAWGRSGGGWSTFRLEKSFETAEAMMARRGVELTDVDRSILTRVYELTAKYRPWES